MEKQKFIEKLQGMALALLKINYNLNDNIFEYITFLEFGNDDIAGIFYTLIDGIRKSAEDYILTRKDTEFFNNDISEFAKPVSELDNLLKDYLNIDVTSGETCKYLNEQI